jgi:HD-GYP domain-containing protein (c-di-GMP phosphodiesterase class II)
LSGEAIPLDARIIAVPDAFDAMTSARPRQKTLVLEEVLRELESCRGTQFAPEILEIFLREKIYRL